MKSESIVFAIAGVCFGIILGWVLATQEARRSPLPAAPAAAAAAQTQNQRQAPPLDEGRVKALTTIVTSDPKNAPALVQLGNVYFDAERWDEAIQWYQRALDVDPRNADASTDMGVSYYYSNRTDEALARFEESLKIDPRHTKTLLNKGIVLAFGKQDLQAASVEWRKVVELAPNSPEAEAARRALEGVASAVHADAGAAPATTP